MPVAPGTAIGAGTTNVVVTPQRLDGLSPGTVYHYRVVARSEVPDGSGTFEEFAGPDQTFTTQGSSTSFALPDGREWEQVSPPG